jgi:RNA polymerase-binding transcription factor DksA
MPSTPRTHSRQSERSARNPWSTEPELPPDRSGRGDTYSFDALDRLLQLDAETRDTMKELSTEIDAIRPLLGVDATAEAAYVSAIRRLAAAEQTAVEVHAARRRLSEGTYGFCATCAEPIPAARLEVRPHSRDCVSCS